MHQKSRAQSVLLVGLFLSSARRVCYTLLILIPSLGKNQMIYFPLAPSLAQFFVCRADIPAKTNVDFRFHFISRRQ